MKKNAALLLTVFALAAAPASAADKQHLQMMAEIRLLQEQQQQLQQLIGGLQDTLKALNARLDDQAAAQRKATADQTLAINNMGDNVRVLKEKADETNVRVSQVSQEIGALRQAIASQPPPQVMNPAPAGAAPGLGGAATGAPSPTQPGAPAPTIPIGVSPQRMYETALDDYTAGRWDLAIQGFTTFIAGFPGTSNAASAQFNIGQAYYNQSKWPEARDAYQKVVTNYAQVGEASTLADATYKLGATYEHLNQIDAAKQAYQTVVQKYPSTMSATMANSALQRLNRK